MDEKELEKDIPEEELSTEVDEVDEDEDDDDIEFDDDVNFEALSQQFQKHIDVGIDVPEPEEEVNAEETHEEEVSDEPATPAEEVQALPEVEDIAVPVPIEEEKPKEVSPLDDFPKDICKKYVVYITPDNIDFVDNLSIDDRNRLINKVIYDQHILDKKKNAIEERKKYIQHLIVVCLTIIIGFPVLFFAVNKSLQASISNYEQSQKNFEKLYKEKGKISSYQKLEQQQQ